MENTITVAQAKQVLKNAGYYVDNLWQVEDVSDNYECTEEEALEVLDSAMQNDATMEQIWFAIKFVAEDMELIKREDV
jgi:hypothetical protein